MTRSQQILRYIREATDDKEVTHTPAPMTQVTSTPPPATHNPIYHTTYAPVFHSGTPQSSTPAPQQTSSEPREFREPMSYEEPKKPKGMSKAKHFLHGAALGTGAAVGGLYAYGQHLSSAAKAAAIAAHPQNWT